MSNLQDDEEPILFATRVRVVDGDLGPKDGTIVESFPGDDGNWRYGVEFDYNGETHFFRKEQVEVLP